MVATIGGQPLKAGVLNERLKPIVYQIRLDAYEITRQQAEQLLSNLLLLEEARRRQIGPEEIIRTEVSDKVPASGSRRGKVLREKRSRINGDLAACANQPRIFRNANVNVSKKIFQRVCAKTPTSVG